MRLSSRIPTREVLTDLSFSGAQVVANVPDEIQETSQGCLSGDIPHDGSQCSIIRDLVSRFNYRSVDGPRAGLSVSARPGLGRLLWMNDLLG